MTCKKAAEVGESYFRRFFFSRNLQRFPFFYGLSLFFARLFLRLNSVFRSVFSDFRLFSADFSSFVYANEADVLNVALFGMTVKEWREENSDKKGNIRDYAEVSQLVCLSNLGNLNAYLIERGISRQERLVELNKAAIPLMKVLAEDTLKLTDGTDE